MTGGMDRFRIIQECLLILPGVVRLWY